MEHVRPRSLARWIAGAAALASAVAIAGCGGGGTGAGGPTAGAGGGAALVVPATVAPAVPNAGTTSATIALTVPGTGTQSARRRSAAVATIRGFGIVVTAAGASPLPAQFADVSAGSPNCTTQAAGGRSCTIAVTVPVGTSTLAVTTYNAPPSGGAAAGSVLSTATTQVTTKNGVANSIALTLNSVVAAINVAFVNNVQLGASGTVSVLVNASDADGNLIVADAYANPISIAITDSTGAVALNTATIKTPGDAVTLTYNGALPPVGGYPLTVSAANVSASAVTGAAVYRPDAPGGPVNVKATHVGGETLTTVIASPYPTAAFGTPFPIPSPTSSFTPDQSLITRTGAGPTVTFGGQTVPVRSLNREVYANNVGFRTASTDDVYSNSAVNGNRIDGLTMVDARTSVFTYATGTTTSTTTNVYPQGVIISKAPLTNGDSWTSSPAHILIGTYADTRPTSVLNQSSTISANQTQTYAADGSLAYTDTYASAGGYGGTTTATQKPDGSSVSTYTDVNNVTEVDTYGVPVNGSIPIAVSISGPAIQTLTLQGSAPIAPGPTAAYSNVGTTVGPVALDPRCALTAPNVAYVTTETSVQRITGAFVSSSVHQRFFQPGFGLLCSIHVTSTAYYSQNVNVTLMRTNGSAYGGWNLTIPSALAQTVTNTSIRAVQTQGPLDALRAVLSTAADPGDGGSDGAQLISTARGGRPQ